MNFVELGAAAVHVRIGNCPRSRDWQERKAGACTLSLLEEPAPRLRIAAGKRTAHARRKCSGRGMETADAGRERGDVDGRMRWEPAEGGCEKMTQSAADGIPQGNGKRQPNAG